MKTNYKKETRIESEKTILIYKSTRSLRLATKLLKSFIDEFDKNPRRMSNSRKTKVSQ